MTAVLEQEKLYAYGVAFPKTKLYQDILGNPLKRELLFFKECKNIKSYSGEGTYFHAKNVCNLLWRQKGKEVFQWHEWLEAALEAYCENDEILLSGPASAGKTFGAALYALLFWMCDPQNSAVIACSTTLDGLKRRIWGDIRMLYKHIERGIGIGNLIGTPPTLQTTKGDPQHGIFGFAVAAGNEEKALGRIIGFHPHRLLFIVDELTDVSEAVLKARTNLKTGKVKFQFIGIGNAASIFDAHGKMCEPKDGWGSVTVESDSWETRNGGICLHFDGFKSPNVIEGRSVFPFLVDKKQINDAIADNGGEDTPGVWRFVRGFWCPEGTTKTIISENLIKTFLAFNKAVWEGATQWWASLDPAFEGGDRCIIRFGKTGKDSNGNDVLELGENIVVKVDLKLDLPIHYQIARFVKEECLKRGVDVSHFGMDVTGEGGGLASIISQEWEPGFHQVEFGGSASDFPISPINQKSCKEEYFNKVTELWYSFRTALTSNQIRGLDAETAIEFCSRLYTLTNKIQVEPKKEMKSRIKGKSPDNADAVVIMLDMVKHRGGMKSLVTKVSRVLNKAWDSLVASFKTDEADYSGDAMDI